LPTSAICSISAEAERGERDAALAFLGHHVLELSDVGRADVEVAIGRQDDAVDAAVDLGFLGLGIGERQAFAARGRSTGFETVQRGPNLGLVLAGSRFQHQAGGAGIDHDGHLVVVA
jgi:hypothetical protein